MQMIITWHQKHESMELICLFWTVQAGVGINLGLNLNSNQALFECHSLCKYNSKSYSLLMTSIYPNDIITFFIIVWYCTMSQSTRYLQLVPSTWHCASVASLVTKYTSKRACASWCDKKRSFTAWECCLQSYSNAEECFQTLCKIYAMQNSSYCESKGGPAQ